MGTTLLLAAIAKAVTPGETAHSLAAWMSPLGALGMVSLVVQALVAVEAALGVWLVVNPSRTAGWAAVGLMGVFAAYALALWLSGIGVGCGCGIAFKLPGIDERAMSIGRAVVLALAVCPLWWASSNNKQRSEI